MSEYTLETVKDAFYKVAHMSSRPAPDKFTFYKEGTVIDEEQSVRWNREEVERRNAEYAAEVSRLKKKAVLQHAKLILLQNLISCKKLA